MGCLLSTTGSHSCYVWCHKTAGGFMTQGWKLPNGTPCGKEPRGSGGSISSGRYCVNGECRAFDCDGFLTDADIDRESCSNSIESNSVSSASMSSVKISVKSAPPTPAPVTIWTPTTSCYESCLEGSQGVRLVKKSCQES
jgi:hypothetical protein